MFEVDLCEGVCTGVFSDRAPSGPSSDSNSIDSQDGSRVVSFRPRVITVADADGGLIDEGLVHVALESAILGPERNLVVNWSVVSFRRKVTSSPKGALFVTILCFANGVSDCFTGRWRVRVPSGPENGRNPRRTAHGGQLITPQSQIRIPSPQLEPHGSETTRPWGFVLRRRRDGASYPLDSQGFATLRRTFAILS